MLAYLKDNPQVRYLLCEKTARYEQLQARLDQIYLDKLDGKVPTELWEQRSANPALSTFELHPQRRNSYSHLP